jgi:protease-4
MSTGTYLGGLDRVALLRIEGVITAGERQPGMFAMAGAYSDTIVSSLRKAVEDDTIKALVIRVNSPGGSAAGSEEIFNAIVEVKGAGKPVVVSMADVAASGGYFVSAPADVIYANATTLTGSIGVIFQILSLEGLFDIVGLDMRVLKGGERKDIGSPYRPMTEEEKKILQGMIDETHEVFIEYVAEGRNMAFEDVQAMATGDIWTGKQAKELGMIDELGGLRDAILKAAELAGIEGEPVIEELGKVNLLDELLGIEASAQDLLAIDRLQWLANNLYLQPLLLDKRLTQLYR